MVPTHAVPLDSNLECGVVVVRARFGTKQRLNLSLSAISPALLRSVSRQFEPVATPPMKAPWPSGLDGHAYRLNRYAQRLSPLAPQHAKSRMVLPEQRSDPARVGAGTGNSQNHLALVNKEHQI